MANNVLSRALKPTNISRLAAGAAVAAAFLAGAPAVAANHHGDRARSAEAPVEAPAAAPVRQQPATQATAAAVVKVAESQVGVSENAAGGGTPFQKWYMSSPRAKETAARDGGNIQDYANAPWCAMFLSWVGEKAGARPTMGWDAYTIAWAQWFKNQGRLGSVAKPGAVVFFSWDGKSIGSIDHVGLVKKDNHDGTITTVEGNTGHGKVEVRIRPKSQVVGYGYPQYRA